MSGAQPSSAAGTERGAVDTRDADLARAVAIRIGSHAGLAFIGEAELHAAVAKALRASPFTFSNEFVLSPEDRIDFLVADCVGVECKTGGSPAEALAQLNRYAQHERIRSLVLVSSRLRHGSLPLSLNGKPIVFLPLLRGLA